MALSIYKVLREQGTIDQDALAQSFARRYHPMRGYGMAMHGLLARIREGANWAQEAGSLFGGQGSFGNGAAMRVAPVGGYFADEVEQAAEQARLAATVTHTHPEAAAGAMAVAVGAAYAWQACQAGDRPTRRDLIDRVLSHIPESTVRQKLHQARDLDASLQEVVSVLGNGSRVTSQDTVPFVLWSAGEHLHDYEEAIWRTAAAGGDVDTTCAMVGAIIAMYVGESGLPAGWVQRREPLPAWAFES